MRTLVISDLHLGVRSGADVLGQPQALDVLCSRLDGVDRLVLLGDTLELRHGPARDALAARGAGHARDRRRARVWRAGHDPRRQPRPRARRRLAGLARSPRGARAAVARRARRAAARARGSPSGWRAGWGRRPSSSPIPASGCATTSTRCTATISTSTARSRRSRCYGARAMARMVGAVPRARRGGGLRGAAGADLRVDPRQRPALGDAPARGRRRYRRSRSGARCRARARGARRPAPRCAPPSARRVAVANRAGLGPVRPELSGAALRRGGLEGLTEIARRLRPRAGAPALRPHPPHRHALARTSRASGARRRERGCTTAAAGSTRRTSWAMRRAAQIPTGPAARSPSTTRGRRGWSAARQELPGARGARAPAAAERGRRCRA